MRINVPLILLVALSAIPAATEAAPPVSLPDPLRFEDGTPVESPQQWEKRRAEIIDLLLSIEYGHMPPAPDSVHAVSISAKHIKDVDATLHRAELMLGPEQNLPMQVGCYVPDRGDGPFPVVLAVEPVWEEHLYAVAKKITDAGYIFAGYQRHDLDRDDADRTDGVHPLYPDYDWASLAVWAWGAMRVVDFLEQVESADVSRLVLTGHSRAGKVALLAGALDTRIALTVPHASGAGGAGSFHIVEAGVETLELITDPERFHYWFHPNLATYAGKVNELPFDQHFLRALVAPRAVLSVDGLGDQWANPTGTRAMRDAAQPVFDFLGAQEHNLAYFRPGGHDTTSEDWDVLLSVAEHVRSEKPLPTAVPVGLAGLHE
jgi:dienelactone hydrolase